MLFLKRFLQILLLQVLLLANITESTVVVTANIDDIKRLINKVISKTLADRIAVFLGDIQQTNRADISQENEKNAVQIQEISDDDTKIFKNEAKYKSADRIKKSLLKEGDEVDQVGTSGIFETPTPPEVRFSRKHKTRKAKSKKHSQKTTRNTPKTTKEGTWSELGGDNKKTKGKKESREENIGQSLIDVFKKRIFRKDLSRSKEVEEAKLRAKPDDECKSNKDKSDCNKEIPDTVNEELNVESEDLNNDLDKRERQKQSGVQNYENVERDRKPQGKDGDAMLDSGQFKVIATSGPLTLPQRKPRVEQEWWEKEFPNKAQSTTP